MIKEDYVSFEVAKLLKEKGFDEPLNRFYEISTGAPYLVRSEYCRNSYTTSYAAPTLQMAMKWLREKHKIYIMIDRSFSMKDSWHYCICVDDDFDNLIQQEVLPHRKHEEACEAAMKYSLENLI